MAPEITPLRTAALQSGPGTSNAVRAPDGDAVSAPLRVERTRSLCFRTRGMTVSGTFPIAVAFVISVIMPQTL